MRDLCRQARLENCLGNPGCWLGRKSQGGGAAQGGARRRELDWIVVWRLDCWGRSLRDLASTLQELASLNVPLSEVLDLSTPSGPALADMLVVFAHDVERDILRDRVKAC
jgi:hypothetical protein